MKKIITISREFGSGGREIGEKIAKKLGIPCYDKYIIEKTAEESGFDKQEVDQRLHFSPTQARFASRRRNKFNGVSIDDLLYIVEKRIIERLANEGPCVFVGRCADFILKDNKEALHVFVYGDPEERMKRIVKVHGETDESPLKRLQAKDRKRAVNYAYYTEREWGERTNYDLMVNATSLGVDTCVDYIIEVYKNAK